MSISELTSDSFSREVLKSGPTVLVDFWASWCGPCRMMAPILEEVASERPDIRVFKVNIDAQPDLAARFQIAAVPTLMVFKSGAVTARASGMMPKSEVLRIL